MKNKETIKQLARRYVEEKISDSEIETLYYLIHQQDLEETVFSEQYRLWENISCHNDNVSSQETFDLIRNKLNLSEGRIVQDELILKGLKFNKQNTWKTRLYAIGRYAAVFVSALIISGLVYYLTLDQENSEIVHHEITVPNGSKIKLVLADSSIVWLNSGSTLRYPDRFAEREREVFLEGEAFFDVRKKTDKAFYVRTSDINIKVLGTKFNVKTYPGEDMIVTTLVSGQLQIEGTDNSGSKSNHIILQPNQKAYYSKKSNQLRLGKLEPLKNIRSIAQDPDDKSNLLDTKGMYKIENTIIETSWKDNRLIFRDEKFSSLAEKLERWYGVEIVIKDEEIKDYKFSGTIEGETLEQAMNAFQIASSMEYKIDQNKIEILKKN